MSLVGHWKCDDNAASTVIVATVGSNGTLEGGDNTNALDVAGPGGSITGGLLFNGSDDRIDLTATGLSFATSTAFSVSMWFRRVGTNARLIGAGFVATDRIRGVSDTALRAQSTTSSNTDWTVPSMGTTLWHHVLFTRTTGNSMRVFLDGTESISGAQTVAGAFTLSYLGYSGNAYTDGFRIAQVKIFDSDESGNVASLYAEGVTATKAPARFRRPYRFFRRTG